MVGSAQQNHGSLRRGIRGGAVGIDGDGGQPEGVVYPRVDLGDGRAGAERLLDERGELRLEPVHRRVGGVPRVAQALGVVLAEVGGEVWMVEQQ